MKYAINSELGVKRFEAESLKAAKEQYTSLTGFDFDGFADHDGSWYLIDEDGIRVEDETANMPG